MILRALCWRTQSAAVGSILRPSAKTSNSFPALQGMLDFGDESINLISALRALTWNGAISVGRENDLGTLEPGKLATFIVLDRNLSAVEPSEIGATTVVVTVFEGEVVYENQDLESAPGMN